MNRILNILLGTWLLLICIGIWESLVASSLQLKQSMPISGLLLLISMIMAYCGSPNRNTGIKWHWNKGDWIFGLPSIGFLYYFVISPSRHFNSIGTVTLMELYTELIKLFLGMLTLFFIPFIISKYLN